MNGNFYREIQETMEKYENDRIEEVINSAKYEVRKAAKKGLHCCVLGYYCADKWKASRVKEFFGKEGFALGIEEDSQFIGITVYW